MSEVLNNRAGIRPAETVKKYSVTTDDVCAFLQNKINLFTTNERKNGKHVEDIKINLISVNFSKKYVPFVIVFPENAFNRQDNRENEEEVMPIFLDENQQASAKINNAAWSAVQPYVYVAKEKNEIRDSKQIKRELEIDDPTARRVAKLCPPTIQNIGKGQTVCMFLLDPIKIFADMFCEEGEFIKPSKNSQGGYKFIICIENQTTRITEGVYRYSVTKKPRPTKASNVKESDIHKLIRFSMNR